MTLKSSILSLGSAPLARDPAGRAGTDVPERAQLFEEIGRHGCAGAGVARSQTLFLQLGLEGRPKRPCAGGLLVGKICPALPDSTARS